MKYLVWYNGFGIPVEADNVKQARHRAYLSWNYGNRGTDYGKFMNSIEEVEEREW